MGRDHRIDGRARLSASIRASPGRHRTTDAGDLAATTSNGDATVEDLEYTATTERRALIEGALRGGGDALLTLTSSNGDVTLRPAGE